MKSIRSLFVFLFAAALAGSVAVAGPREPKKPDSKPDKSACCPMKKGCDSVEADKAASCCGGEKAACPDEKKQLKKDKQGPAGDKAAKADCPPCDACKE